MLRLFGPTLLTLSLAFPSASFALGLGDIHVESSLHQTLVARIDLVGATNEDLPRLTAGIASEEIFRRYNLERPAFLAGTAVVVGQDGQGHPVLVLRSSETFTEPLVTFLVALHSPIGEMIREYTVLLDPAGLASKPSSLESTPATPAAETVAPTAVNEAPERAATAPDAKLRPNTYTVARRDTLDGIARIAGAHSRSERHRMMIAIFRANPGAFQSNFNALHRGTTLHFPTEEQLFAISTEDAAREYEAQMAAWHASNHRKSPTAPVPITVAANPVLDAKSDNDTSETDKLVLTERIESLEKSLHELRQELKQPLVLQTAAPVVSGSARSPDTMASQSHLEDPSVPAAHSRIVFASLAVAFGLVLAGGAWFLRRRRNGDNHRTVRQVMQQSSIDRTKADQSAEADDATQPLPQRAQGASRSGERVGSDVLHASSKASTSESGWFKDSFSTPIAELLAAGELTDNLTVMPGAESTGPVAAARVDAATATPLLPADVEVAGDTVEQKFSFFTPDSNTNITHVIVGSGLEQPRPFVERRKSPADVLRQALEREPHRSDLRLKLLELYYTAAAENRRAFLEASRQLAKNDKLATEEDWSRIAAMGRAIAPDDELFCDSMDNKAVA
jgi:pilus assembly protein FimV